MTILKDAVEWRLNGHMIERWCPLCPCTLTTLAIEAKDQAVRAHYAHMLDAHRQSSIDHYECAADCECKR